jgi:hypothetical protein
MRVDEEIFLKKTDSLVSLYDLLNPDELTLLQVKDQSQVVCLYGMLSYLYQIIFKLLKFCSSITDLNLHRRSSADCKRIN